jgi:hypothetical protein
MERSSEAVLHDYVCTSFSVLSEKWKWTLITIRERRKQMGQVDMA